MKQQVFCRRLAVGLLVLLCGVGFSASAQYSKTSFLMRDAHQRMRLNPALTPTRGYVDFPILGSFNVSASSNGLSVHDVIGVIDGGDLTSDAFYNSLSDNNRMNMQLMTDIVSAGWRYGDNFWSVGVGVRGDLGFQIPKSMFTFVRDASRLENEEWSDYLMDIENERLHLNTYTELGVGLARQLDDRLSVGARAKFLLGMGNLDVRIDRVYIETSSIEGDIQDVDSWKNSAAARIEMDARMRSSLAGMRFVLDENGVVRDLKLDSYGVGGYGGAVDFGAAYKVNDALTVSMAVNDFGFIRWTSDASRSMSAEADRLFTVENYEEFLDIVEDGSVLNYELFGFKADDVGKARTTWLYSSFVAGAEYRLLGDKLSLGVLSTTRTLKPTTQTELMFSAALCPRKWFNVATSCSVMSGRGTALGLAMKLGPLFIGSDYLYFGEGAKTMDGYLGISIPLK